MEITGAQLVVKALKAEKTDTLFAYPGGQVIDLFNELYDEKEIRVITPRHEQGLVHAADGYARASGKTGVCIVTSGPGTTNLVTGIATANIDSVPLVCFTGQVSSGLIGRESFQEVNTIKIMKSICKYVVTVRDRSELGKAIRSAFQAARSGRPGAAVVDLPKDIQQEMGSDFYPLCTDDKPEVPVPQEVIDRCLEALRAARKPLFCWEEVYILQGRKKKWPVWQKRPGYRLSRPSWGKGSFPQIIRCIWGIWVFTEVSLQIWPPVSVMFCLPSALGLTTA